jgi:hypothetical protein
MLAVAIAASDASVLLVQRSGADAFARGGEIGGLLPVVGVHLDEGVVSWAAANGAAGAALRGAGPGEVATVQAALPAGAAPETSAFAATTTPDGSPVIATAHGRTVRIVELACE